MITLFLFVVTLRITAAFMLPSEILKRLSYQDTAYIIDRVLVEPEEINSNHDQKIKNHLKDFENELNDIIMQDKTPKLSNIDERSFVYLKQRHRTPRINVVHGSPDMLGKSNARPITDLSKTYLQDLTQKAAQRYIDNFLKGYTFLKPTWQISNKPLPDPPKIVPKNNTRSKLPVANPEHSYSEENDMGPDIDDKIKFVEFLKPPPLVRCDQRKGKHDDYIRDIPPHTTPANSFGHFDNAIHPMVPTRSHNSNEHIPSDRNLIGNICDHKHPLKESLCIHIYNSHIEECVRRLLGKDNENAVRFLSKCIRDINKFNKY